MGSVFAWLPRDMDWLIKILITAGVTVVVGIIVAIIQFVVKRFSCVKIGEDDDAMRLMSKYKARYILDVIWACACVAIVIGIFVIWGKYEDAWRAADLTNTYAPIMIAGILISLLVSAGFIYANFHNKSRYQALLLQQTTQEYYMSNYGVCSYENLLTYMGERAVCEGYELIETDEENHPGVQFDLFAMRVKVNYNFGQRHTQLAVLRAEDMTDEEYIDFLGQAIDAMMVYAKPKKKVWVNSFAGIVCIVKEQIWQQDFEAKGLSYFKEFSAFLPVIIEAPTGKIFYMGGEGDYSHVSDLNGKEIAKHQFRYIKGEIEKLVLGKAASSKKKEKDFARDEMRRDRIK